MRNMEVAAYMVVVNSYFTRGPRVYIACYRLSKFELSATKVNDFQRKAVVTKISIVNIADIPVPPVITIFDKVTFNLTQATLILFNLIAIY